MIILDANILKSISLRGSDAEMLRTLRAVGVERVAAPWIAMEEIAAQQALSYRQKHEAAVAAMDVLRKATPWGMVHGPDHYEADLVRDHWRGRYSEVAEVLETPAAAYQAAMYRETNVLAPCKTVNTGKNKTGARDAAIWLTAVDYAKTHPTETVYFVSNNTEDFGDGSSFPFPMDEDIKGIEDRFFLFTSLDAVLTRFAKEVPAEADDLPALLMSLGSRQAVMRAAWHSRTRWHRGFGVLLVDGEAPRPLRIQHWAPHVLQMDSVKDVSAREIDGHKWTTATVRWLAVEDARVRRRVSGRIAYAWETRVLLSPTAADPSLRVLDSRPPTPVAHEEIPHLPAITTESAVELLRSGAATVSGAELQVYLESIGKRASPERTPGEQLVAEVLLHELLASGLVPDLVDSDEITPREEPSPD
ncbi:PIN domain-containing protein [Streptomyces sp. NPDC055893]